MGMFSMIPAIVTILCLCSSGIGSSYIGYSNCESKKGSMTMQLCCCCLVILIISIGGTYLVATSP